MAEKRPDPETGKDYPYVRRLDVLHGPLGVVDVQGIIDRCTDRWWNQTLCSVNDSVVRLGIVQGEYHWHKHDDEDEFFYVFEGRLPIDLGDRTVDLGPRQGFVVPRGVRHRPRAPERTVILMVEGAGIVPTGDWGAAKGEHEPGDGFNPCAGRTAGRHPRWGRCRRQGLRAHEPI